MRISAPSTPPRPQQTAPSRPSDAFVPARPTSASTPVPVRDTFEAASGPAPLVRAAGGTLAAPSANGEPLVSSAHVFSDRRRVTLDTPVRTVGELDRNGKPSGWRAELEVPLAAFGLGGATISKLAIGMPWRQEAMLDEPLPFTVDGGTVHITVPNIVASLDAWGRKTSVPFEVWLSDGRSLIIDVQPRQVTRDTTALKQSNLEGAIFALKARVDFYRGQEQQLRDFIAEPTHLDTSYGSGSMNGVPYGVYATQQLAQAQQALAQDDTRLASARAAIQAKWGAATPGDQALVLSGALARLSTGGDPDGVRDALLAAQDEAVNGPERVANLQELLDADRSAGLSPDVQAATQAELAQAQATVAAAVDARTTLMAKARALAKPDDVLVAADTYLQAGQGLQPLLLSRASHANAVETWTQEVAKTTSHAAAQVRADLPRVQAEIAEAQAQLAQLQAQYAAATPETITVDVHR